MTRSTRTLLTVLAAASLVLASCGDDSTQEATSASTTSSVADRGDAGADAKDRPSTDDDSVDGVDHFANGGLGRFDLGDGGTFTATSSSCGRVGDIYYDLVDGQTEDSVVVVLEPMDGDTFWLTLLIHGDVVGEGVATVEGNFDGATFATGRFDHGETFSLELLTDRCGGDDQTVLEDTYGFVTFEGVVFNALERSCTVTEPEPDWPHIETTVTYEIYAEDGTNSFVLAIISADSPELYFTLTRFGDTEPAFSGYVPEDAGGGDDNPGALVADGEFDHGGTLGINLDFEFC